MVGHWHHRAEMPSSQQLLDAYTGNAAVLDHKGVIIAVNRAWDVYAADNGGHRRSTGVGASYLYVCERAATAGSADGARVGEALHLILSGSSASFTSTYRYLTIDVEQWYCLHLAAIKSHPLTVLVTHDDVTAHEAALRNLQVRASQDPLTGLGNRIELFVALTLALAKAPEPSGRNGVGLVYMDLDDFKPVNDTHGHTVGDEVLQSVSRRLRGLSRPGDTIARLGGDEFALCAPGISAAGLEGLTRRIAAELVRPHDIRDVKLSVPASVGSHLADVGDDAAETMDRADAAMYAVKHRRRHDC